MSDNAVKLTEVPTFQQADIDHPPLQLDQEWANAVTHGLGACMTIFAGCYLILLSGVQTTAMMVACLVYIIATLGTCGVSSYPGA